MSQTKLGSLKESVLNVSSGLVLSFLMMTFVICPFYGMDLKASQNLEITVIFTITSIIRTYIWRRINEKAN